MTSSPTDTASKNYTFLSCGCALLYVVPPEKVDELVADENIHNFLDRYTQTRKKYHMDAAWVKHRLRSKWQELVNMRVKEAEDFEEKEKEGKEKEKEGNEDKEVKEEQKQDPEQKWIQDDQGTYIKNPNFGVKETPTDSSPAQGATRIPTKHVNLSGFVLSGIDLSNVNLINANLSMANVTECNLCCCDLTGANITGSTGWKEALFAGGKLGKFVPRKSLIMEPLEKVFPWRTGVLDKIQKASNFDIAISTEFAEAAISAGLLVLVTKEADIPRGGQRHFSGARGEDFVRRNGGRRNPNDERNKQYTKPFNFSATTAVWGHGPTELPKHAMQDQFYRYAYPVSHEQVIEARNEIEHTVKTLADQKDLDGILEKLRHNDIDADWKKLREYYLPLKRTVNDILGEFYTIFPDAKAEQIQLQAANQKTTPTQRTLVVPSTKYPTFNDAMKVVNNWKTKDLKKHVTIALSEGHHFFSLQSFKLSRPNLTIQGAGIRKTVVEVSRTISVSKTQKQMPHGLKILDLQMIMPRKFDFDDSFNQKCALEFSNIVHDVYVSRVLFHGCGIDVINDLKMKDVIFWGVPTDTCLVDQWQCYNTSGIKFGKRVRGGYDQEFRTVCSCTAYRCLWADIAAHGPRKYYSSFELRGGNSIAKLSRCAFRRIQGNALKWSEIDEDVQFPKGMHETGSVSFPQIKAKKGDEKTGWFVPGSFHFFGPDITFEEILADPVVLRPYRYDDDESFILANIPSHPKDEFVVPVLPESTPMPNTNNDSNGETKHSSPSIRVPSDVSTLYEALKQVQASRGEITTIILEEGTYSSNCTLVIDAMSDLTITGEPNKKNTTIWKAGITIKSCSENITIRGITIAHSPLEIEDGATEKILIDSCGITGIWGTMSGVEVGAGARCTLKNCDIYQNNHTGLSCCVMSSDEGKKTSVAVLDDCCVHHNGSSGVSVQGKGALIQLMGTTQIIQNVKYQKGGYGHSSQTDSDTTWMNRSDFYFHGAANPNDSINDLRTQENKTKAKTAGENWDQISRQSKSIEKSDSAVEDPNNADEVVQTIKEVKEVDKEVETEETKALKDAKLAIQLIMENKKDYKGQILIDVEIGNFLKTASDTIKDDKSFMMDTVLTISGTALKYASNGLKRNKETVMVAVAQDGKSLQYASDELKKDKEIVLVAVAQAGESLQFAAGSLRNDSSIALVAIKAHWLMMQHVSEELKSDKSFMLQAVEQHFNTMCFASEEVKDRSFMLRAVKQDIRALKFAPKELKQDEELMAVAVKHNDGTALNLNSVEMKYKLFNSSGIFMLAAVTKNGTSLQCASDELKIDKEIVVAAVAQDGVAWEYASDELRNDKEIVMAAVAQNGHALGYASDELRNDKEIAMAAMTQLGKAYEAYDGNPNFYEGYDGHCLLKSVSKELQNDLDLVQHAIKMNGCLELEFASEAIRNNRTFMLQLIQNNIFVAFYHAGDALKNDKELVLLVLKQDGRMLGNVSQELQRDVDIIHACVLGGNLEWATREQRKNEELVLLSVGLERNGKMFKYASKEIKNNKEVVLKAVSLSFTAYRYINDRLQKDPDVLAARKEKEGWESDVSSDSDESSEFDESDSDDYDSDDSADTEKLLQRLLKDREDIPALVADANKNSNELLITTFYLDSGISSVACSPDSKTVAVFSDNMICVWNIASGQLVKKKKIDYELHGAIEALSLNHTFCFAKKYIHSTTSMTDSKSTYQLHVCNVETGECIQNLNMHTQNSVESVVFSPNNKFSCWSTNDVSHLWNVKSGEYKTFQHDNPVNIVAVSHNNQFLLTADSYGDNALRLWDVESGKTIQTFKGHTDTVTSLAFSVDDQFIVSSSKDNTVRKWNIEAGFRDTASMPELMIDVKLDQFKSLADVQDVLGFHLNFRTRKGRVVVRSIKHESKAYKNGIRDGHVLRYIGDFDTETTIYRNTFMFEVMRELKDQQRPMALRFVCMSAKENLTMKHTPDSKSKYDKYVTSVAVAPNNKLIVTGSKDRTVRIFNIKSRRCVKILKGHKKIVTSVAFSLDNKYVLSGSEDQTVRMWNVEALNIDDNGDNGDNGDNESDDVPVWRDANKFSKALKEAILHHCTNVNIELSSQVMEAIDEITAPENLELPEDEDNFTVTMDSLKRLDSKAKIMVKLLHLEYESNPEEATKPWTPPSEGELRTEIQVAVLKRCHELSISIDETLQKGLDEMENSDVDMPQTKDEYDTVLSRITSFDAAELKQMLNMMAGMAGMGKTSTATATATETERLAAEEENKQEKVAKEKKIAAEKQKNQKEVRQKQELYTRNLQKMEFTLERKRRVNIAKARNQFKVPEIQHVHVMPTQKLIQAAKERDFDTIINLLTPSSDDDCGPTRLYQSCCERSYHSFSKTLLHTLLENVIFDEDNEEKIVRALNVMMEAKPSILTEHIDRQTPLGILLDRIKYGEENVPLAVLKTLLGSDSETQKVVASQRVRSGRVLLLHQFLNAAKATNINNEFVLHLLKAYPEAAKISLTCMDWYGSPYPLHFALAKNFSSAVVRELLILNPLAVWVPQRVGDYSEFIFVLPVLLEYDTIAMIKNPNGWGNKIHCEQTQKDREENRVLVLQTMRKCPSPSQMHFENVQDLHRAYKTVAEIVAAIPNWNKVRSIMGLETGEDCEKVEHSWPITTQQLTQNSVAALEVRASELGTPLTREDKAAVIMFMTDADVDLPASKEEYDEKMKGMQQMDQASFRQLLGMCKMMKTSAPASAPTPVPLPAPAKDAERNETKDETKEDSKETDENDENDGKDGKDGKAISSTAPAINLHLVARIRSQANSYLLHVVQKSSAPDDIVQALLKEFPKAGDMPPFRRRIEVWQEIADFLGGDLGRWFSIIFIYPVFFLTNALPRFNYNRWPIKWRRTRRF